MKTTTIYNRAFWNAMRGNQNAYAEMNGGTDHTGGYLVPTDFNENYFKALEKENIFRRLATVVNLTSKDGTIYAVASTGEAEWLNESVAIPESNDAFKQFPIRSHKLASLSRIKETFVKDNDFNLEGYLENEFSRRFGRSEENAFINGDGINEPTGILNATGGGEIGVTAENSIVLTYDDIIKLYFSLKSVHRRNAVWLMNDDTAFKLRTLKDNNGNYLWNQADNTILGKPVEYSNHMPNMASGEIPVAFGDFSYYWIVERQPLTIKVLRELYFHNNEIGCSGYQRLDGKLILKDAVKLLRMA